MDKGYVTRKPRRRRLAMMLVTALGFGVAIFLYLVVLTRGAIL